jgi:phytoene desaturase
MTEESKGKHAVVIGSGFGGLAAAVRLGARGWKVTVLERHDQPGGRARVFREPYAKGGEFVFDAGPTVITAPILFEELWALCGKKLSDEVDLRPVDPFYRIHFHDRSVFDYSGDSERMRAQIAQLSPSDVEGYERFVAMSHDIFSVGFEQLAHVPFGSWRDMARVVPAMMKLESYRSVYGLVSKFIENEKLRQVLSFHPLLVGGNPFNTTSIYSLIPYLERKWGVHFPIGGTGSLVRGLVGLMEGQGGRIEYGSTVEEILVEGKRVNGVRLEGGRVIPADIVVSNADSAYTYRRLLPERYRRRWTDKKLARSRYSMSLFVWYFGTDRKYEDVAHHTILLGPRYRELLEDIFDRRLLASDFSLYLHRPTATDAALAPPGCESFYVLSPVPHLDANVDWSERSEAYRASIASYLEDTVLPGLGAHVVASRFMNPQHFHDELLSERGAAFGLEPVLTQSAYFRPHNRSEEVEGLFLVGAGTHPGAGVPGVLSSARVLDSLVPDAA